MGALHALGLKFAGFGFKPTEQAGQKYHWSWTGAGVICWSGEFLCFEFLEYTFRKGTTSKRQDILEA